MHYFEQFCCEKNFIRISGWAFSENVKNHVNIKIYDSKKKLIYSAPTSIMRQDVVKHYSSYLFDSACGFNFTIQLLLSEISYICFEDIAGNKEIVGKKLLSKVYRQYKHKAKREAKKINNKHSSVSFKLKVFFFFSKLYNTIKLPLKIKSLFKRLFLFTAGVFFHNSTYIISHKEMRKNQKRLKEDQKLNAFGETANATKKNHLKDYVEYINWVNSVNLNKDDEFVDYIPSLRINISNNSVKYIAFYLPQFHPIPENDKFWGKGFTEWSNVTRAVPIFSGHYQPQLPIDLGFYDLRMVETIKRQAELAKQYGIFGFCMYLYWFGGKRLLETPLELLYKNKDIDINYCLCWANENWTKRWDGLENDVIISQQHSPEDDINFIADVSKYFSDERYIKVDGSPLLIVYRPQIFPDPKRTVERWRNYCRENGIGEIVLYSCNTFGFNSPEQFGFNGAVEFPPHNFKIPMPINSELWMANTNFSGIVYDYKTFVEEKMYEIKNRTCKTFATVVPSWDNTARKPNNSLIFHNARPSIYKKWLKDVSEWTIRNMQQQERFVFINAWNEWAEGAHLEPDRRFGYSYLKATADVLSGLESTLDNRKILYISHDAHRYGAQELSLYILKYLKFMFNYNIRIICLEGGPLIKAFEEIGEVVVLGQDYLTNTKVNAYLKEIFLKGGYNKAICNTVVTGRLCAILKEIGYKVITLVHELPGVIKNGNFTEHAKELSKFSDCVVFPSNYVADKFKKLTGVIPNKEIVRPQGLYKKNSWKGKRLEAKAKIVKMHDLPKESKVVLGVGCADKRKGVDLFCEVAEKVRTKEINTYFIWAGSIDDEFFRNVPQKLKKNVIFTGLIDNVDLYYSAADVFLLTSREDPFPSVVLEAFDAGLPVIGFKDAGGFSDLITKETGILVDFCDTDKMAQSLECILVKGSEAIRKIRENTSTLISKSFLFKDYIYDLLSLLGDNYSKISVIIPNYNYKNFLEGRIDSILSQTYPLYEVIFLDDCSNDGSVPYVNEILLKKSKLLDYHIYSNEVNSGCVFKQWAKGMSYAKGEHIWIAEADDLCEPEMLESLEKLFASDEKLELAYCQSKQIDEHNKLIANDYRAYTDDIDTEKWKTDYIVDGVEEIQKSLAVKNTILNVSAVVSKKKDISPILEELQSFKVAGDLFYYVWMLQKGRVGFCSRSLNIHRRHTSSVTVSENSSRHFEEIVRMQDYIMNKFKIDNTTLKKVIDYREQVKKFLRV